MAGIQRVAVLGAGTMGSRIAAHFANAGTPALLLDLASPGEDSSLLARQGIEKALRQRPSAFFSENCTALVEPGNFDDHIGRIHECQWVIEAVAENLEVKRAIWSRAIEHSHPEAILSTNTSGIRIAEISQAFPSPAQKRFLGTHFFNPPRYLHLLEIIPGQETDEEVLAFVLDFAEQKLGKGVVLAKDTPNFIANRIGSFYSTAIQRAMIEGDYTIEEVDALTGPLIGFPKSASFRLIDIVGLDVWTEVSRNVYNATSDRWRDCFLPAPYMQKMLENRWLGEKAGQGFYKRIGPEKQIHVLDWKTLEYHPAKPVSFESVETVRKIPKLAERLRRLLAGSDRAARFLWQVFRDVFAYSAAMVPGISERIVEIDHAMRWGFGHQLGPFELWDALGFSETAKRIHDEHGFLPDNVQAMLASGASSFYREGEYFDFPRRGYARLEHRPGLLILSDIKAKRGVIAENTRASLIDIGDGVICLEFHSKMNAISEDTLTIMNRAVEVLGRGFDAMIVANEGENFSAGADLSRLLAWAQAGDFAAIERFIRAFQLSLLAIKYAPKPVVAAPFSRALGGGCEVVLQSHRVQAAAELNIGLVELNVGLIPAGGGTKEMALRFSDPMKGLNLIAQARVSSSAVEARELGFLQPADRITMNPDFLTGEAKDFARELSKSYQMGEPQKDVVVSGTHGYERMLEELTSRRDAGQISDYDLVVLEKAARVLSGGRVPQGVAVSEQKLLDLELEAFLSLCGRAETQQRMKRIVSPGH